MTESKPATPWERLEPYAANFFGFVLVIALGLFFLLGPLHYLIGGLDNVDWSHLKVKANVKGLAFTIAFLVLPGWFLWTCCSRSEREKDLRWIFGVLLPISWTLPLVWLNLGLPVHYVPIDDQEVDYREGGH